MFREAYDLTLREDSVEKEAETVNRKRSPML